MTFNSKSEPNELRRLQNAIKHLYGLESEYVESVEVHEGLTDKPMWHGTVEVFRTCGQPYDERVYAWTHTTESGETYCVAVLGTLPVNSASEAVRTAMASSAYRNPPTRRVALTASR